MAKTSRLNPNKDSRSALKQLQQKCLLHRQKVGLRHVIKTDGTVHYVGYDVGYDWYNRHMPNFYPGLEQTYRSVVQYNGERVELTAALGRKGWEGHILDVGTHFEPNPLATQLLAARPNNTWQLLNFPLPMATPCLSPITACTGFSVHTRFPSRILRPSTTP
jgi:hypothetical protein